MQILLSSIFLPMDRTTDYNKIIALKHNDLYKPSQSSAFYDTLYKKLHRLQQSLDHYKKYVDILIVEEKYSKVVQEIHDIFQIIDIEMNKDEARHFEGIKYILNLKVNILDKLIKQSKLDSGRVKVELEPEVPENTRHTHTVANRHIEQEHAKLVEKFVNASVQSTRQRVLEIQEIQDLIGMHVTAQSERIELLCATTKDAGDNVKKSGDYVLKDNGRYARRLLFLILISMSFVLLFIHFYHKK